jgi:hypothetical protein
MKHPKRPRDPAQLAKLMIDIASGEMRMKGRCGQRQRPSVCETDFAAGLDKGEFSRDCNPE